jgi:hypothetical protein
MKHYPKNCSNAEPHAAFPGTQRRNSIIPARTKSDWRIITYKTISGSQKDGAPNKNKPFAFIRISSFD